VGKAPLRQKDGPGRRVNLKARRMAAKPSASTSRAKAKRRSSGWRKVGTNVKPAKKVKQSQSIVYELTPAKNRHAAQTRAAGGTVVGPGKVFPRKGGKQERRAKKTMETCNKAFGQWPQDGTHVRSLNYRNE